MPYYLTHPEHGVHICYTPEDVEVHKAVGWVPLEDQKVDGTLHLNTERKKPGRKPKVKHGD